MTFREFLIDCGLSMEAASVLSGVDTATISRISRGLQQPKPITIVKLAQGLGVSAKRMQQMIAAPIVAARDDAAAPVREVTSR